MVPNRYTSLGVPNRVIADRNDTMMLSAVGNTLIVNGQSQKMIYSYRILTPIPPSAAIKKGSFKFFLMTNIKSIYPGEILLLSSFLI